MHGQGHPAYRAAVAGGPAGGGRGDGEVRGARLARGPVVPSCGPRGPCGPVQVIETV